MMLALTGGRSRSGIRACDLPYVHGGRFNRLLGELAGQRRRMQEQRREMQELLAGLQAERLALQAVRARLRSAVARHRDELS